MEDGCQLIRGRGGPSTPRSLDNVDNNQLNSEETRLLQIQEQIAALIGNGTRDLEVPSCAHSYY
jgi:hypothetical protein